MSELRPDDLPETLGDARRALIVDLNQFWLRIPDYCGRRVKTRPPAPLEN